MRRKLSRTERGKLKAENRRNEVLCPVCWRGYQKGYLEEHIRLQHGKRSGPFGGKVQGGLCNGK